MPTEAVDVPSLEVFEVGLEGVLSNLIKWEVSCPWWWGGVCYWMALNFSSDPKHSMNRHSPKGHPCYPPYQPLKGISLHGVCASYPCQITSKLELLQCATHVKPPQSPVSTNSREENPSLEAGISRAHGSYSHLLPQLK